MKKIIVCMLFTVVATGAFAQEKGKVRLGFDVGNYFGANLLYNIQDNLNVGIRGGVALTTRESQTEKKVFSAAFTNFSATGNYYFRFQNPSAAFVGGGLGFYNFDVFWHDHREHVKNYKGNTFGGFLTTGIEIRKIRLALEYNLLPSSSALISNYNDDRQVEDKVKNNYFAITVGVFMGGGKWGK